MIRSTLLPSQRKGSQTGSSTEMLCYTRQQAIVVFNEAKQRLLDINNWDRLNGENKTQFKLMDKFGNELNKGAPSEGNLIRINLPAPKNRSGNGFDWVEIEKIEEKHDSNNDEDCFGFRARPVQNPKSTDKTIAHFYTDEASSTFLVQRSGNMVTVMEKGCNEEPNAKAPTLLNKIRNLMVALPAMIGFSKPQWKSLVDGILKGVSA